MSKTDNVDEGTPLIEADYNSYVEEDTLHMEADRASNDDSNSDQQCCQRIITFLKSCFQNILNRAQGTDTEQPSRSADTIHHNEDNNDPTRDQLKKEGVTDPTHDQLKKEGVTDSSMKHCIKDKIETFFHGEYNDIVEHQITSNNKDDFQTDKVLTKNMKMCYESVKEQTVNEVWTQLDDLLRYESLPSSSYQDVLEKLKDISFACKLLNTRQNETSEPHPQPEDIINTGIDFETLKICSKSYAMRDQLYELFTFDPQITLSPRLRDISHAYGLLLFHYRKQDPNFEKIKARFEQDLSDGLIKKCQLLFLEMVTVSPPFLVVVPEKYDDGCLKRTQLFIACNTKRKKEPHSFHVRVPIILENYHGHLCIEGLVCKGF